MADFYDGGGGSMEQDQAIQQQEQQFANQPAPQNQWNPQGGGGGGWMGSGMDFASQMGGQIGGGGWNPGGGFAYHPPGGLGLQRDPNYASPDDPRAGGGFGGGFFGGRGRGRGRGRIGSPWGGGGYDQEQFGPDNYMGLGGGEPMGDQGQPPGEGQPVMGQGGDVPPPPSWQGYQENPEQQARVAQFDAQQQQAQQNGQPPPPTPDFASGGWGNPMPSQQGDMIGGYSRDQYAQAGIPPPQGGMGGPAYNMDYARQAGLPPPQAGGFAGPGQYMPMGGTQGPRPQEYGQPAPPRTGGLIGGAMGFPGVGGAGSVAGRVGSALGGMFGLGGGGNKTGKPLSPLAARFAAAAQPQRRPAAPQGGTFAQMNPAMPQGAPMPQQQ